MKMPEMGQKLAAQGAAPLSSTPAAFAAYVKSEAAKWGKVVKDSGMTIN
jgi:tripartite-type tricarboxylate transporter receptor subunit TctC